MIYDRRKSGLWTPRQGAPAILPSWRREAWAFRARQAASGAGRVTDALYGSTVLIAQPVSSNPNGTVTDQSFIANGNGTATGSATTNNSTIYFSGTKSMVFGGGTDSFTWPDNAGYDMSATAFWLEFIIQLTATGLQGIFTQGTDSSNLHELIVNGSNQPQYTITAAGVDVVQLTGSGTPLTTGVPYYLVIGLSGNNYALYNSSATPTTTLTSVVKPANYTGNMILGRRFATSSMSGVMMSARMTRAARTPVAFPTALYPTS